MDFTQIQVDSEEIRSNFADNLTKLMKHTGANGMMLARKIGFPHQTIYRYAKRQNEPTISQAFIISSYFFLSIEDFIVPDSFDCDIIDRFERAVFSRYREELLYKFNEMENFIVSIFPNVDLAALVQTNKSLGVRDIRVELELWRTRKKELKTENDLDSTGTTKALAASTRGETTLLSGFRKLPPDRQEDLLKMLSCAFPEYKAK